MSEHIVKIQSIEAVTHDVNKYTVTRPPQYNFEPGQATEVSINKDSFREKTRPFTFTSLPDDDFLQFTIKSYISHDGVTKALAQLEIGDELILRDIWGAIKYDGPGVFLAAGAGITPFLSIFKQLEKKGEVDSNMLLFTNKTEEDVIHRDFFQRILGKNFISVLTQPKDESKKQRIDQKFIQEHVANFDRKFYVCGPPDFDEEMKEILNELGAATENLVFEE